MTIDTVVRDYTLDAFLHGLGRVIWMTCSVVMEGMWDFCGMNCSSIYCSNLCDNVNLKNSKSLLVFSCVLF